ncbi:hypothetical protein [Bacillus massiliigorillae]|uniref:hypothetical protein n=1 Tax=Bacillus massiliigorillae TaxID=1243664 RepID=UPI00039EB299|nr:hypothetical protein [Bacillus massiliigorillae]
MATYKSPVLYDGSESIVEQFSKVERKRKCLIITDSAMNEAVGRFQSEINQEVPYELFIMNGKADEAKAKEVLAQQKMGTQLYIASTWENAKIIFPLAIEVGYSEEEIQLAVDGEKERHIYCMKCFTLSSIKDEKEVQCAQCHAHLEVGPFFSKVRKGYIGYPFIPIEE